VKFEDLVGGAISGKMRKADLSVPKLPSINQILREARNYAVPPTPEYMQSVIDMSPKNDIGFYQYNAVFEAESERELHNNLKQLVSGNGAKHDHPRVARSIYESFKHKPSLADLYFRE